MLDHRDTHILRSALAARGGPVAERLCARLAGGEVEESSLDREERTEALGALDAFAATSPSFVATARELAVAIRSIPS